MRRCYGQPFEQPVIFEQRVGEEVNNKKARNSGIDFLRILSMYMVVVLHVNMYGWTMLNVGNVGG